MPKAATPQYNLDHQVEQLRLLKIGEVSKLSGIGIEALRFYEKSGLIDRPNRTSSGYRMYAAAVLERLAFIKQAQVLGFSLIEIKQIIDEKRAGQSPCAEVRDIVRQRLQEVDKRLEEMLRYREELAATLAKWDQMGTSEGHICGLIEGTTFAPNKVEAKLSKGHKRSGRVK